MGSKLQQPSSLPESSSNERLDSWKEIAAYLKRDERTVRRWEREGLPVHRHMHKKQASIYAHKAEIDVWWKKCLTLHKPVVCLFFGATLCS